MIKVIKDLTGNTYGKLTVLYQTEDYITKSGKHEAQWRCRCSCEDNTEIDVPRKYLTEGFTTHCGCEHKNTKLNKLIEQCKKKCPRCERILSLDEYTNDCTTKSGKSSICKDCQKKQRIDRKDKIDEWFANNEDKVKAQRKQYSKEHAEEKRAYNQANKEHFKEKRKEYEAANKEKVKMQRRRSRHRVYPRYKKYEIGAIERGFEFTLTLEEFDEITKQPCAYCGNLPEDEFGNKFTGIDRIDSTKGYNYINVIPCCFICNRMKSNYTLKDWYLKLKQIIKHMEKYGFDKMIENK